MQVTQAERAALDEVHNLGELDGKEHLAVLRNDKQIMLLHGSSGKVNVANQRSLFKPGDVWIHNHPTVLNSLSNQDSLVAAREKAQAIYAISRDGSVYKTSKFQTDESIGLLFMALEFDHRMNTLVDERVEAVAAELQVQEGPGKMNESHYLNLRMAKAGWFDYEYELAPETKAIIEGMDNRLNKGVKSWWMQ